MRLVRCLVPVAILALAPQARAAERVELAWSAPAGCPSEEDVGRRIDAKLAGETTATTSPRVVGRIEKEGARYRLTLGITGKGERVLVADTCDALAATAAVVIAMSAREAEEPAPAPATTAAGVATPASPPPRDEPAPRPPTTTRAAGLQLFVRGEGAVDVGTLPSPTPGGAAAIGLRAGRLGAEIAAAAFASQSTTALGDPSRGASFSLLAASARACWTATSRVEIAACAGVRLVRIGGTGAGTRQVAEGSSLLAGPEVAVTLRLPLTETFALRGGAAVVAPVARQAFVITAIGPVHTPSPFAVHGFLGPEVTF